MLAPSMNPGRWQKLSFAEQMANIGSEVERAINWKNKGNREYFWLAFCRALELVDLTINDKKNCLRLTELTRTRETLVDYFYGENIYKSSDKLWQKYFAAFNFAARSKKITHPLPLS